MKKALAVLCLSIFLLSTQPALAADALYRMLHADEVESFRRDQDAIIVGQLAEKADGKFKVAVLKVISGKVRSEEILVSEDFHYGWAEALPAVNDYCVMSLKWNGSFYERAWGIFKADSGDFRTLKLIAENAKSGGLSADLACIEWYVNSGGKEKDFSFGSGAASVRRPSGEVIQIYPKPTVEKETATAPNSGSGVPTPWFRQPGLIVIVVPGVVVIAAVTFFVGRRI